LIDAFLARYGREPAAVYRAPGRVNLIGEHTDYNQGFVLPIAIDLACHAASAPNNDGLLRVYSWNRDEQRRWPIASIGELRPSGYWSDYVIGVARQLPIARGLDVLIHGDVPLGSGLSSSAALEVSSALALGWSGDLPSLDLAKLCQRAENDFIGLPSGIMDQYASIFGCDGVAIRIDCRSLEHEEVALPPEIALVAVNTMVKHENGTSAYRDRVAECRRAVESIAIHRREVQSLRDARLDDLRSIDDPVARRRARHVIAENRRVLDFVEACRSRDLEFMGALFLESHRSLQSEYEVSCGELDFLVETAMTVPGVYGSRMTGGGFGGCTINLMAPSAVDRFEARVTEAYRERFGIEPAIYRVSASRGAGPATA
jgi:galactokinase